MRSANAYERPQLFPLLLLACLIPAACQPRAQQPLATATRSAPALGELARPAPLDARYQSAFERATILRQRPWTPADREALLKLYEQDPVKFVQQLIYFDRQHPPTLTIQPAAQIYFGLQLRDGGRLGDEPDVLLRGSLPFLADEPRDMSVLGRAIADIEGNHGPEFAHYESFLWNYARRGDPPSPLVTRMYRSDPGLALLTFNVVDGRDRATRRRTLLAEHIVSDYLWREDHQFVTPASLEEARRQLADLAGPPSPWYARVYVATILKDHPALRTPELLKTLRADKDPYVQKALASWDQPASQPATEPASRPAAPEQKGSRP